MRWLADNEVLGVHDRWEERYTRISRDGEVEWTCLGSDSEVWGRSKVSAQIIAGELWLYRHDMSSVNYV